MTLVEEIQKNGIALKIYYDENCPSPCENYNLGTMVCWHHRHSLGHKHNYCDPNDFLISLAEDIVGDPDKVQQMSIEQCEEIIRKNAVILPLYLFDHSGLVMRTYPFSDPWDSGQVGWIYVLKEKIREEYKIKNITKKVRDRVVSVLNAEVKTYSQWMEGDVYGYILEDTRNIEKKEIDSCWGFFGTNWKENGIADYIPTEYRFLVKPLPPIEAGAS